MSVVLAVTSLFFCCHCGIHLYSYEDLQGRRVVRCLYCREFEWCER